jgi:hypothetical protein
MSNTTEDRVRHLEETVEQLQANLRALSDRAEIFECLHKYTKGLDRRDWDLLKSAYHDDARDQHGSFIGSPDEFIDYVRNVMQDWDYSVHFLDLNNLELNGDEAHTECYVLFTQRRVDGGGLDFGGGRYLDRLVRRDGEWAIATRKVVIDWSARTETTEFGDVLDYRIGTFDRSDPSYERPLEV